MFDHTIQTDIYEKVLKKHYLGIISIDFEHQGKIEVLYEDKDAFNRDAIFPLTDQRTFDEYVQNTLMKYVAGDKEDICRIQAQLKKESILQGTAQSVIHHVMINFMLDGQMRFMQFDFIRINKDSQAVLLFVEDYTDPQQQAFVQTLKSVKNSAALFKISHQAGSAGYEVIFFTEGCAKMMEVSQEEMWMHRKPFNEAVHPDDLHYVEGSFRKLSAQHPHINIFYRVQNPYGKWFYLQSDLSYIMVGDKEYIYVTYQDISVMKKNEELSQALRHTKQHDAELASVNQQLTQTVATIKKANEELASLQEKALNVLGSVFVRNLLVYMDTHQGEWIKIPDDQREELGDKPDAYDVRYTIADHFMKPEYKEGYLEFTDLSTLAERLKGQRMIRYIYRSPNEQWIAINAIPQKWDEKGNLVEVLFATRNVSEERNRELEQEDALRLALASAEHANKAKTAFLNNMSHDIRTPMNAIIGFTALAVTHVDQPEVVKDYLTKIGTSSQHLLSLINDVLDMSRIESGIVKIEENEVHIPDVLHDLRTIIQGNIHAKQHDLYIDTQDIVHENVITDKLRLNQILLNVVGNAIKFTPTGGMINLRISEKPCSKKGYTTFEFRIKDNGIGMSKEFQEHVFDSFSRERSSTKCGIPGTGLGMAITKNIVDMMNGTITLTSQEGKGTEFVITLDFKLLDTVMVYGPIPELVGARALVVDDDIHTCTSVSKMLRDIEMRADWSTSGKEAIIRAKEAFEQKDAFEVYIIDWLMPDMNGIETVRRIRGVIGDSASIIILSAYDWADIEQEAREAGVTAFVEKPIFMSELRKVLTQPIALVQEDEKWQKEENRYAGKKVLLVEDNALNSEIATAILEKAGIVVDAVEDGMDAVNRMVEVDEETYDLILMDIQMPKMDGYTATREIRMMKNNRKANIPIIAMTANAFEEDRRKAFQVGMNAHITKPIDIKKILATFDQVFQS